MVFDAATAYAIKQHDSREAFAFGEASKARSLLEFVKSEKPIAEVEKSYASGCQTSLPSGNPVASPRTVAIRSVCRAA